MDKDASDILCAGLIIQKSAENACGLSCALVK
jgi:hypothetical protein